MTTNSKDTFFSPHHRNGRRRPGATVLLQRGDQRDPRRRSAGLCPATPPIAVRKGVGQGEGGEATDEFPRNILYKY
jgi:hypothetical protein